MFDLGDVVPLTVQVRDAAGNLANATTVTLTIGLPDGTSISPSVTNPSTGTYQYDYPPTLVGRHTARWVATGLNASAYTDAFDVRPADSGLIVSLADTKKFLNITSTGDDDELRAYIESVTRVVENYRNEVIARRTVVEEIDTMRGVRTIGRTGAAYDMGYENGGAKRRIMLGSTPVLSLTSVARVDGTYTWDLSQIDLNPDTGGVSVLFGPLFYGFIRATYVAGYSIVPSNYTMAALIIIEHLWQLQRQPSIGGSSTGGLFARGEMDASLGGWGAGFAIPNRAAELLGGRPAVIS